jgi:hypothetical protein
MKINQIIMRTPKRAVHPVSLIWGHIFTLFFIWETGFVTPCWSSSFLGVHAVLHNAARETPVCYFVACASRSRPPRLVLYTYIPACSRCWRFFCNCANCYSPINLLACCKQFCASGGGDLITTHALPALCSDGVKKSRSHLSLISNNWVIWI